MNSLAPTPLSPSSPLATLRRGAGDGKDLAVVLAAALRAEGIPAHVALLRPGTGRDIEPTLPGMGMFSHAIVYVPGEPPLWIDPTDRWARPGELPLLDQGRRALVAAAETEDLVETPLSVSSDQRNSPLHGWVRSLVTCTPIWVPSSSMDSNSGA